ncbi:MAG: efflux RND transporter periplasmic adaptor subunit [Bacteroidota bacterium]
MQINNHLKRTVLFFILTIACIQYGCKNEEPSANEPVIAVQTETTGIDTLETMQLDLSDTIRCEGTIEISQEHINWVSAPAAGFVTRGKYHPGDMVRKGSTLVWLENPDYIIKQQEFFEVKAWLEYHEEELKRKGELTIENATSIKVMQRVKAEYETRLARYHSLEKQLNMLGIPTNELSPDNFTSTLTLTAPVSGYIIYKNTPPGRYIQTGEVLYKILNKNNYHILIHVNENDILKMDREQKVYLNIPGTNKEYTGTIQEIEQKVNAETRTVTVRVKPDNGIKHFIPGMKVFATIITT